MVSPKGIDGISLRGNWKGGGEERTNFIRSGVGTESYVAIYSEGLDEGFSLLWNFHDELS